MFKSLSSHDSDQTLTFLTLTWSSPSPDLDLDLSLTIYLGRRRKRNLCRLCRQLYLMLYEICYLDIPSILAQSFYVCTTKEDIIYWMSVKMSWMKSKLNINIRIIFHTMKICLSFISHKKECFWQTISSEYVYFFQSTRTPRPSS